MTDKFDWNAHGSYKATCKAFAEYNLSLAAKETSLIPPINVRHQYGIDDKGRMYRVINPRFNFYYRFYCIQNPSILEPAKAIRRYISHDMPERCYSIMSDDDYEDLID